MMPDISYSFSMCQFMPTCQLACWEITVNSYFSISWSLGISYLCEDEPEGLSDPLTPESSFRKRRNQWGIRAHTQHFTVFVCRDLVSVENGLQARKGLAVLNVQKGQ